MTTNLSDTLAALSEAAKWLRECSDWLLSNDLDMTCPMQTDPLDLAEALDAIRTGQLVPVPSVEVEGWHSRAERLHDDKIVTHQMIQDRMQEEIDDLRAIIAAMQEGRDG